MPSHHHPYLPTTLPDDSHLVTRGWRHFGERREGGRWWYQQPLIKQKKRLSRRVIQKWRSLTLKHMLYRNVHTIIVLFFLVFGHSKCSERPREILICSNLMVWRCVCVMIDVFHCSTLSLFTTPPNITLYTMCGRLINSSHCPPYSFWRIQGSPPNYHPSFVRVCQLCIKRSTPHTHTDSSRSTPSSFTSNALLK